MPEIEDAEKIASESWMKLLKRLPLDGGPSSTKFVYLGVAGAITGCLVLVTIAFCGVYAFTKEHTASLVVATLLGSTLTAVIGFAVNSQNQRRALNAQAATSPDAPAPAAPEGNQSNG